MGDCQQNTGGTSECCRCSGPSSAPSGEHEACSAWSSGSDKHSKLVHDFCLSRLGFRYFFKKNLKGFQLGKGGKIESFHIYLLHGE